MVCYDRMKTLYDVQEFLKLHGYINLFSKRLDAIFFMAQELKTLYDAGLIPNERDYFTADLILRREHRLESEKVTDDKKIIGIDLGGTTIKFGILTTAGEVQDKWAIDTTIIGNGKHIIPDIIQAINHRLDLYHLDKSDFLGIGMGSPGSVDIINNTVIGAYNLGWDTLQEVGLAIESGVGLPFSLDNDANVAALGERWVGAGENNPDVIFMTLGTGVGGGIIAAGNLIHGVAGAGGEIGHVTVDISDDAFDCTCGKKGCLETVASATGIVRVARKLAEAYEGESHIKAAIDNGDTVSSKDIFISAEAGDIFANSVVEKISQYLGLAAGNLANTLNPDSIIIGGGVSAAGEFLRSRIETYFNRYTFPQVRDSTKIKIAELGNDAGIIGAASLALKFSENEVA